MAGAVWSRTAFALLSKSPPLSFSTLGCPTWPFADILTFAAAHGYEGIELRGILGEMDLTKCPEFSGANIAATRRLLEERQLRIVNLGASSALHHPDGEVRRANLDEARRFIDLAHQLDCPHVRVFPDSLAKDRDREATFELIVKGLVELGDFAKGSKVDVLMETHGDVLASADVLRIMRNSESPDVGLVWDVCNMWSVTKESPTHVYEQLKPYIRHTHIKDVKLLRDGGLRYVLLGEGDAPVAEAVHALAEGGYTGFYSFEWEKRWHPEIEEPEIALAHYAKAMQKYF
jgi:sugar phosphate isomerase/epimerase